MKTKDLEMLEQGRAWQNCGYCRKDGKVPRSNTDIWDDCPECDGAGGFWVASFNVQAENNPLVVLDPERTICPHNALYADHIGKTIRCKDCGAPVEIRPK